LNPRILELCRNEKGPPGTQVGKLGILFDRPAGEDPENAFVALQEHFIDAGGDPRAVGLKSGEADRQRVEERTRQNS
jgi:hypothetical protein